MPRTDTRRQHYVPRTYLKHFAQRRQDRYFIHVLPIENQLESAIHEEDTNDVCHVEYLYYLPGDTVEERMLVEDFYSNAFENDYNSIQALLTDSTVHTITVEQRKLIISTVIAMLYRTTKWLNLHNETVDRVLEQVYSLSQFTGRDYVIWEGERIELAGKTLDQLKSENRIQNRPEKVLSQLRAAFALINTRIERSNIQVLKLLDNDHYFISSDNPVCYYSPYDPQSPFNPSNTLSLPLDSKHLLNILPYGDEAMKLRISRLPRSGELGIAFLLSANRNQARNAEKILLGKEVSLKSYLETNHL